MSFVHASSNQQIDEVNTSKLGAVAMKFDDIRKLGNHGVTPDGRETGAYSSMYTKM